MTTQQKKLVEGTDIELYNQAPWDRDTVADGIWLQSETLDPISANDRILASAINKLNERIDFLTDASDVINVYGNWDDFVTHSGELFDTSAITNNDIIKVLNDKNEYPNSLFPDTEELTSGHQTYFRWSADNAHTEWPLDPTEGQWEYIGHLDPYYNTSEIDDKIEDLSATIKSEYVPWTATDCPIGDKNIANNYSFAQGISNSAYHCCFAQGQYNIVKSYALAQGSGNSATLYSLAQGYKNNVSNDSLVVGRENEINNTSIGIGTNNSARYNSVVIGHNNSADNQSFAVGAYNSGSSDGFSHGIKNISNADSLAQGVGNSATNRSLVQGYYNYANYYSLAQGEGNNATTYSLAQGYANYADKYSVALGLNCSATEVSITHGDKNKVSYKSIAIGDLNSAYMESIAIGSYNSASNYSQAFGKGIVITNTAMSIGSYNKTSANIAFIIGNGTDNNHRSDLFWINKGGDVYTEGDISASNFYINGSPIDSIVSAKFSAYNDSTKIAELPISTFKLQANTAKYISATTAANTMIFNVSDALINSASSGYQASAWITTNESKITYTTGFKGSEGVITGYNSSAFAGGISSISAKTGNSTALFTGYNVNIQAGPGIGFNFGTNLLTISANANYTQGRCITIDDQNKINLSSDINLDSRLVINHYTKSDPETYASAYLGAYKLDFNGSRDYDGDFYKHSATYSIYHLNINNYYDSDNLHFAYLDESKLQLSAFNKVGNYNVTTYANLTNEYYETQWAGSPSNYYLKFNGHNISAGSDSSNVLTTSWLGIINNAKGTWVSGTTQEITIDAPYQTKFVVTSTIPTSLKANTYYII